MVAPSSFHDVRFPIDISFGSTGGSERRTEIVTLASGHEYRNSLWRDSRRRYDAGYGVRSFDDLFEIMAFFEARQGSLYSFRWRDWVDYKSCLPSKVPSNSDQNIGSGDGVKTTFNLYKAYESGTNSWQRLISKPVRDTVLIAVNASSMTEGTDFTVDYLSGSVTFSSPPGQGLSVTAGFEFDIPVRFSTDSLDFNLSAFKSGEVPSVPIIEVRQ